MKRILMTAFMLVLLFCAISTAALADENTPEVTNEYYLVQAQDSEAALALKESGKTNIVAYSEMIGSTKNDATSTFFSQFENGSHIKLTLAENIFSDTAENQGVLINTPITVTIVFNGFTHVMLGEKANNCFVLKHSGSKIRLIGSNGYNEDDASKVASGEAPTIVKPTISNRQVVSWDGLNIDVYAHQKVYVWVYDGDAYLENIRGYANEEILYSDKDNSSADGSKENTYVIKNCVLGSNGKSIALMGEGSATKFVKIYGGWYNAITVHTVKTGSVVENVIIAGQLLMDCWSISGQTFVLRNSTIGSMISYTGRTWFELWDCNIDINKIAPGADGGGAGRATLYTSATCTEAGTKTIRYNGGKIETDSEYPLENPALGHTVDKNSAYTVFWQDYFQNGLANGVCVYCGEIKEESEPTVSPLAEYKGYTYSETDGAMAQCFKINKDLVPYLGDDIDFGIMAKVNVSGEDIAPSVGESGVVSASFKNTEYSIFSVKVTGIPDEYKDTNIVMCAYIAVDGKIAYLSGGKTSSTIIGTKYSEISQ